MPSARLTFTHAGTFSLEHGTLRDPEFAYECIGELNEQRDNAILLFTGLSPSAHVCSSALDPNPGWWEDMVGPDKPIDTTRYHVICVNSLGSCFGSTGPASNNPETQEPYRLTFPSLTIEDIARAGAALLDGLGIDHLAGVVGASMGGMTALAFAVLHPDRADRLLCISSGTRTLPYSIGLRSLQREIIRDDPAWKNGEYAFDEPPSNGMRLARKLGMITYRSPQEWLQRFGRERITDNRDSVGPFGMDFEVESYLDAHANKFIGTFDANCYLYLSRAMDLFDIADHGGSLQAAIDRVKVKQALVMGVSTDILFPMFQQEELATALQKAGVDTQFVPMNSLQGHDAFLVDMDGFRPPIGAFFA